MTIQFLTRLALPILILFVAVTLPLTNRTYDPPSGVAALLPGASCGDGCVLGITPGETTRDEAIRLLEANPLVGEVLSGTSDRTLNAMAWRWKSNAGPLVSSTSWGAFYFDSAGTVLSVHVPLHVPMGIVRLVLGQPEALAYEPSPTRMNTNYPSLVYFYDLYAGGTIDVRYAATCPMRGPLRLLDASVSVQVYAPGSVPTDRLTASQTLPSRTLQREVCGEQ